jgi:hypothetical protein
MYTLSSHAGQVVETGQTNSIMTFFELSEPSSTKGEDYAETPTV